MKTNYSLHLSALVISFLVSNTCQSAAPQVFSGSGAAATSSSEAFKAAIKTASGKDSSRIGWDAVKLDGTDANPKTRIISANKTVEIPTNRFQNLGVIFADPYTVSGDGFASVNPNTAGQFPAFSPNNTFAMFDPKDGQFEDRNIQQKFVLPNTETDAGTRGFGAIFMDVEINGSSSIEYFGKDAKGNKISLGKYYVGAGSATGEAQFLGVLFDSPVIAEVEITVGSKALFSFNGSSVKAFGAEDLGKYIDLVVTDDFLFAVPETLTAGIAKVSPADCLLSWAEGYLPNYFPAGSGPTLDAAPYKYRYYAYTKYYLGVSSYDYHVYYLDPNNYLGDAGEYLGWLYKAGCQ